MSYQIKNVALTALNQAKLGEFHMATATQAAETGFNAQYGDATAQNSRPAVIRRNGCFGAARRTKSNRQNGGMAPELHILPPKTAPSDCKMAKNEGFGGICYCKTYIY